MNSREIESWALRVIDQVKSRQPNEDFLVELKREWIFGYKAARQIAGHANAARGENILWLIGVDEKQCIVVGANSTDLANWYPAVESLFSELSPRMTPLNIPVDGVIVVALLFETDRTPFVIKNPVFGSQEGKGVLIALEVPWRENTSTRSANRSDIIRLLAPLKLLPEIEILDIKLRGRIAGQDSVGNCYLDTLDVTADLYIVPSSENRVIIPFHRCRVEFEISGIPVFEATQVELRPASELCHKLIKGIPGSLTIQHTTSEIIVNNPGRISLKATVERPSLLNVAGNFDVRISIYLLPTAADRPVVLIKNLPYPVEEPPS